MTHQAAASSATGGGARRAGRRVTIFDEATAVRKSGAGRYEVRPDARFALVPPGGGSPPAVNGGVLMATVLRCVLDTSPHPHPVATSTHFLRVPQLAPAQVEVTWLKQGRTAATARASLIQDATPLLELTVTTGTVSAAPAVIVPTAAASAAGGAAASAGNGRAAGLSWTGAPPVLPPIEECIDLGMWPGAVGPDGTIGYAGQVEMRLDPATTGWRHGTPAGIPEMRGYFRLRED